MKYKLLLFCFSFISLASFAFAPADWPKTFSTNGSTAKLYEPQPESYTGNVLKIRAAISLLREGKSDPVFGVLWADVKVDNQSNNVIWQELTVSNIKFPGEATDAELNQLSTDLQKEVSSWNVTIAKEELSTQLQRSEKESKLATSLNNTPPKILYTQKPSILVLIDGQPQLSQNSNWGVEQVTNTPFTIVKNTDQQYYLYGNKNWFRASSITGQWSPIGNLPSRLQKMDKEVRERDTTSASEIDNSISNIVVSTEPAELIQSKGEANFSPIEGTNLLYMSNSANDIFMDVNTQQYYTLISGRWYRAPNLNNSWTYTSADKLPTDFAKIPEGSPKDVVLPNVAGTDAANESVMEAQVPQTAKVDRRNAQASVTYDGEPQFERIEGTRLKYAVNTSGTVLNLGNKYYSVENGVWFESRNATGPWTVATSRPTEVENIPPSYPVYNAKYVYIYDATPDYVYMGYTPGYLGNYIYGPTIVYGTGYYYKPWRGRHYYPRAVTWGYNMRYNPWTGWNFGINYWGGWFSFGFQNYYPGNYWGGWWGPSVYRPCYYRSYNHNYGYYGRNVVVNNYTVININRNNNIYRNRRDVVTYDRPNFNYVRNNGRSTPYNSYNNGRYNNGRSMQGNNNNGGNDRGIDRRPNSQVGGDRQVSRPYTPNGNQSGRVGDRGALPGNNNGDNNGRITGRNGREIGNPSEGSNAPRIYTPGNNDRNNGNRATRPNFDRSNAPITSNPADINNAPRVYTPGNNDRNFGNRAITPNIDRSNAPIVTNPDSRPQGRPEFQNRAITPNPNAENPRMQQDRPERMSQQRIYNPQASPDNSRQQGDRPSNQVQNRASQQPSYSPQPRMDRPVERQSVPSPRAMERPSSQPSYSPGSRIERPSRDQGSNGGGGGQERIMQPRGSRNR